MRRVALGQHIAERDDPVAALEHGRSLSRVAEQAPRRSPRSLADHHHVDFAAVRHAVARHAETKIAGSLGICVALRPTVERKTDIIDHVDGENMIADAEPRMAGIRDAGHSPAENQCGKSPERRPTAERGRKPVPKQQRADSQYDQRDVENDDEYDRGPDVAQQLAGLGGVRRKKIREHVHRDDRPAEQIQQHDLERAENHQRKRTKHQQPGPLQRHGEQQIDSSRHQ